MKYRKKPIVIEAIQVPPDVYNDETMALDLGVTHDPERKTDCFLIQTLEGEMRAYPGDWIIRGIKGELYPCKPDIFAATYEKAE